MHLVWTLLIKVFEIFCGGVTVTGVSEISNLYLSSVMLLGQGCLRAAFREQRLNKLKTTPTPN